MKKTKIAAMFLAIVFLASVIQGCASPAQQSSAPPAPATESQQPAAPAEPSTAEPEVKREPINLIFSHYQSTGSIGDNLINSWCEEITKASDGLITFTVYGGGSLGAAKDHYDMVRSGACDIAYSFYGIHTGVFKSFETFSLPMLGFENAAQASAATWDFYENNDYAQNELSQTHLLMVHSYSPCVISTNKFKIETTADLKGKSLRIMGGPINQFFTNLGASSMTVPIPDIYENLQKGIMNGYIGGVDSIIGYNLYECSTNLLSTPIAAGPFFMWMNLNKWQGLPDWAKDIFNEYGGMNGALYFGTGWDENDKEVVAALGNYKIEINALSDEEYKNWESAAAIVTDEWIADLDKNGYDGKAVVDTVITLRDKYAPQ